MARIDVGYEDSLEWTYPDPQSGRPKSVSFVDEYASSGEFAKDLINAAKRRTAHGRPSSIDKYVHCCRMLCELIRAQGLLRSSAEVIADEFIVALRKRKRITDTTRATYFANALYILREYARVRHQRFERTNPFVARNATSKQPIVHGDELAPIIEQARKDVLAIAKLFRSPSSRELVFIQKARSMAKGRLFTPYSEPGSSAAHFAAKWCRETNRPFSDLTLHLYPSPQQLVPFFLLLSIALAANPDSLGLLRRDGITAKTHPYKGPILELQMEKPRSGDVPQRYVRDSGTLSEGWLLRLVLDLSAPLLRAAHKRDRNYVFLCMTNEGNIAPFIGTVRANAVRAYLKKRNLPKTTTKALRTARLTDEWIRTRDPMRVFRLSGNKDLSLVADYVLRRESADEDAASIASAQRQIAKPEPVAAKGRKGARAVLASHTCLDPLDPSKEKDRHGFCASALWPYNDVHFVMPLEPKPVSFVLRDYIILCEAEKILAPERFTALYATKKRIIETEYLPLVDDDLRSAAVALIDETTVNLLMAEML